MTATTEVAIWLALRSRIESIPISPTLPKAYPASTFEPAGAYIAVGEVTSAPLRRAIGPGPHIREGMLMLSYVAPLGQDASVYKQVAGRIAAHFPEDLRLWHAGVGVRITSKPHVQQGYREGGYFHVPVIVPWQSLT